MQISIEATEGGKLILTKGNDGDIWLNIGSPFSEGLRFCTATGGGIRTAKTRRALAALMDAMEEDGGEIR